MTPREYYDSKETMKKDMIKKLQEISDNLYDPEEIIKNEGRVFDFEVDLKSLASPTDLANLYHYKADPVILLERFLIF